MEFPRTKFIRGFVLLRRIVSIVCLLLLILVGDCLAQPPVVVSWSVTGPVTTDVGTTDFNNASMIFAPLALQSDSVTVTTSSGANGHSHGGLLDLAFDVRVNNVWTNLVAFSLNGGAQQNITGPLFANLGFGPGIVDGVRFTSVPGQDQTYHNFSTGGVTFTFSQLAAPAGVPEIDAGASALPCAILLFTLLAFVDGRRNKLVPVNE